MAERPRFRIFDLVVAVAAAGVAFAATVRITGPGSRSDVGEIAFWLNFGGFVLVAYGVARFVRDRGVRWLILGVTLAFAASAVGVYGFLYVDMDYEIALPVAALAMPALVLVAGGVAHGLLDRWHELKDPPRVASIESPPTPHPLDREPTP